MQRISFAMTQDQVLAQAKDVTRRMGWHKLKVGAFLLGVDRTMGFKRGQKAKGLAIVEVPVRPVASVSTRSPRGMWRAKASPASRPSGLSIFFAKAMKCQPSDEVTRIEFRYVGDAKAAQAHIDQRAKGGA